MTYEREELGEISPQTAIECRIDTLESKLSKLAFPISKEDLLNAIGDEKIPCSAGDRHTLAELLGPLSKEQYNSIQDIRDAMAHPVRLAHLL